MVRETALMARLTRVLADTGGSLPLADRLISALSVTLDVDGGGITIGFSAPDRTLLCATDAVAVRVEELQDLLREGPSLDAFRTRRAVAVDLQQQGSRWPLLVQHLTEHHPTMSLFAVPIQPEDDVLGVVSLYRAERAHEDFDVSAGQFLSNAIGVAIVGRFERPESTDLAWSTRDRINQATGMVVVQLRIPPGDALALLRAHAFAQGVSLADVAEDVVARRLDFRSTDGEGSSA